MGTIRTTGSASREVAYDRMIVKMRFRSREKYTRDAVRQVSEECEGLLVKSMECGASIDSISGGSTDISWNSYSDEEYVNATRAIEWEAEYSTEQIDLLTQMIEKGSYCVNMDINPYYSESDELHKDLKLQAAREARKIADEFAVALGTKIKGPSKINVDRFSDYLSEYMDDEEHEDYSAITMGIDERGYKKTLYSKLKSPTTIEEESLTIEWELEE